MIISLYYFNALIELILSIELHYLELLIQLTNVK